MDEDKAKMAKGCMALRNNNGGFLLIGFDDDGTPDRGNAPSDIRKTFHGDVIQAIVGQFSSESFPVEVQFSELDGVAYPVICVPSGVRTPVAGEKKPWPKEKPLIKDHAVYVRSLTSNNTVSSSEARRGDWDRLVQICLDNREADIGAFVRRHLTGINLDQLGASFHWDDPYPPSVRERSRKRTLDRGRERFIAGMKHARLRCAAGRFPRGGCRHRRRSARTGTDRIVLAEAIRRTAAAHGLACLGG